MSWGKEGMMMRGDQVSRFLPILLALVLSGSMVSYAQIQIRGVVRSEQGEPLAGVSIRGLGSMAGGLTDEEGRFLLTLQYADSLRFHHIGYHSITRYISRDKNDLLITLLRDDRLLHEVEINTGYYRI